VKVHATPYIYPEHLRGELDALPHAPGVYLFHDDAHDLPLYIGKSVDLRARVQCHLRNSREARLLRQARRITHLRTAGDMGAQLLEARLIKQLQPLHNQRLRRTRRLCSVQLRGDIPVIVETHRRVPPGPLYGVYGSRHAALDALRVLADEHGLCYRLLGLESTLAGRPCFRAQLGRCRGACCGSESLAEHTMRLRDALARRHCVTWPYPGAVALREVGPDMTQLHVVDNWHCLGSVRTLRQARALVAPVAGFDRDGYRILSRFLHAGTLSLVPL
jgi:excinuclease Cho